MIDGGVSAAWTAFLAASLGFALGSIPFGLLVLRAAGGPDPRSVGSGNIGATNVVRAGGKGLGALTLLLDAGKGALAVLLAAAAFGPGWAPLAGAAAILGHCFSPWLSFRGGKGVATFLGASIVAGSLAPLVFVLAWGLLFGTTRVSAIAGVGACMVTALFAVMGIRGDFNSVAAACALGFGAGVVTLRHRSNFKALIDAREARRRGGEPT